MMPSVRLAAFFGQEFDIVNRERKMTCKHFPRANTNNVHRNRVWMLVLKLTHVRAGSV